RLTALDAMRQRRPGHSVRLMLSMLPESHEINMPTHEPNFRDWKPVRQPIRTVEYISHLAEIVSRLLHDAGVDVSRWTQLLEDAYGLPPADRTPIYDNLERFTTDEMDIKSRTILWQTVRLR